MHQHYLWDKTGEIDPFTARLELALVEKRRKVQAIGGRCSGAAISPNEALRNEPLANEALLNEALLNEALLNEPLASQASPNPPQFVSRPDVLLSMRRAKRLSTGRVLAAASMLVAAATLVLWLGHHHASAGVSEAAPKPLASGVDMDASGGASALRGVADPLVAGGLGSDCDPAERCPVPDRSVGVAGDPVAGDAVAGDAVAGDPVEGLGVDAQPAVVAPATAR